jgi:phosphoglycolate phosphatase-like HAD superfamily hydrolase
MVKEQQIRQTRHLTQKAMSCATKQNRLSARISPSQSRPRPTAILFDLDGTLIDTMQIFADVAADLLHETCGMDRRKARECYLETSGIPFRAQLDRIQPKCCDFDRLAGRFEHLKRIATSEVRLTSAVTAALCSLRDHGIGIAISSNNYDDAVQALAQTSPVGFDFALGYSSHSWKGEPHVQFATTWYGCRCEDLLFVGDSLSDASTSRRCGVPFVAVTGTFSAKHFASLEGIEGIVESISDLPGLFEL